MIMYSYIDMMVIWHSLFVLYLVWYIRQHVFVYCVCWMAHSSCQKCWSLFVIHCVKLNVTSTLLSIGVSTSILHVSTEEVVRTFAFL